jgi:hypothetical protein
MRRFCLAPSSGMINRRVIGCQGELKIADGGQAQEPRKSDGPLRPSQEKIRENTNRRLQRLHDTKICSGTSAFPYKKIVNDGLRHRVEAHRGHLVHSEVRAKTKEEAERIGKYMIRPLLSLERLSSDEKEGKVGYGYGKEAQDLERMDYLEFVARVAFLDLSFFTMVRKG